MKNVLETYQLELKVCGPVFIGSGEEIQKKEYMFLGRNKIGVVDVEKLYALAVKKRIASDLEKYMLEDTREDLKHWALRNRVSDKELEPCMRYTVDTGDLQLEKGKKQIMACIKDPYGNPYIPGSSIKGMLRTILLCAEIVKNPKKYAKDREQILLDLQNSNVRRNYVLAKNIGAIETKAFHVLERSKNVRDAVNDMLSSLIIADSEPLKKEDIILCQKWERHVDGNCKTLNLLRECLKPGTIIKSTITIDTKVCKLNIEDIVEGVKLFYQMYYENFQSKFRSMNNRMSDQTVFLGGGSGFVSKTMIYAMFGAPEGVRVTKDIFFRTNVPRQHKHQLDTRLGVSPHILKCTRYQGKECMIGQCELSFR